jgi:hypothetical protein
MKVPPIHRLNELTEEEIFIVIDHFQSAQSTNVHAQFWIDELSRRRTEGVLRHIADATAESADQVERLAALTDKGAKQTE